MIDNSAHTPLLPLFKGCSLGPCFYAKLWDFLKAYPSHLSRNAKRCIPAEIREDLLWWNRLLADFNAVLIFDETHREITQLFTDAFKKLPLMCFGHPRISPKPRPLLPRLSILANCRSIRIRTARALMSLKLKRFSLPLNFGQNFGYVIGSSLHWQLNCWVWPFKNTLIGQPHAPLRELLLLASKYDIVIEARWIKSEENGLADALSRFDEKKVANLCPYWQHPFSSMIHPQPIYNQYQVLSL